MSSKASQNYQKHPFTARPSYQRHPDYFRVKLELCGIQPPAWSNLLELGCGSGDFLNCLAYFNPEKSFLGVDEDEAAIEKGRMVASKLNLKNIKFKQQNFQTFQAETSFDVVAAYGVYSWIDPEQRQALLETVFQSLTNSGFAALSHNLLPGWKARGELSEIIRAECSNPKEARAKLSEISGSPMHGYQLADVAKKILAEASDAFIFHEMLNPVADASSSYDFRKAAEVAGFTVTDCNRDQLFKGIPPRKDSAEPTIRNALLLKSPKKLGNKSLFKQSWFTSKFVVPSPGRVFSPRGEEIRLENNLAEKTIAKLASCWPSSLSFTELVDDNEKETLKILKQLASSNTVEVFQSKLPLSLQIPSKPKAEAISVLEELYPGITVNCRFEFVKLNSRQLELLKCCKGITEIEGELEELHEMALLK